jgi:hypothetical protein
MWPLPARKLAREIAEVFDLPDVPDEALHSKLRHGGIIESRRQGKNRFYQLARMLRDVVG